MARTCAYAILLLLVALSIPAAAVAAPPEHDPQIIVPAPAAETEFLVLIKQPSAPTKVPVGRYTGDTAIERAEWHKRWIPKVARWAKDAEGLTAYRYNRQLGRMRASYKNARQIIRAYERALRKQERLEAWVDEQAPAPVYSGGDWAIPTSIVMCESGGDYGAQNPSGAFGAYQLLPSHFDPGGACADLSTDPAGQDECAARLWNGGAGAGNWSQCL
jgi:hypothetical protein